MIDLEARDGVAWLRLNRPEALNALDRALTGALEEALTREHAARRLTAERQAIIGELERAKAEYLAATKGSPF